MNTNLEQRVYGFIRERGMYVTCHDLAKKFGRGNTVLLHGDDRNIMIGFWISANLARVLTDLGNRGEIISIPCDPYLFLHDGVPKLPIAFPANAPEGGYKTLHWFPVEFRTYEQGIKYLKQLYGNNPKLLHSLLENVEYKRAAAKECKK